MTKFKPGDRVEVKITGDVVDARRDGPAGLQFVGLDNEVNLWTGTPGIQIRKVARRKPPVGSYITVADLIATPWKRGTVIKHGGEDEYGHYEWRYMLLADGTWIEDSGEKIAFRDFEGVEGDLQVVYLPTLSPGPEERREDQRPA